MAANEGLKVAARSPGGILKAVGIDSVSSEAMLERRVNSRRSST